MWWLLLLPLSALAQEVDLSAIRELDERLPTEDLNQWDQKSQKGARAERRYTPPNRFISFEEIKDSGTQLGSLRAGIPLVRLSDNSLVYLPRPAYLRHYNREDEHGYKYLIDESGNTEFKVRGDYVSPIKQELALYEPPTRYTPAPKNIVHREYDQKLKLLPEASFYAGMVVGNYMHDLFNDKNARSGVTNQYGAHLFTEWDLPVKVGAVVHYEQSTYDLTGGGKIKYSALSFGPQFKTKDFELFTHPVRFQAQFRISPFAKATAETIYGAANFKFNSADLLTSLERPVVNSWGQFVFGLFFQSQWLNLKEQDEIVSVRASNLPNTAFGLSFSQVFN